MTNKVNKNDILSDIVRKHPEAIPVLREMGMNCIGCPSSSMETLEQAAEVHARDIEDILNQINGVI